MMPLQFSLLLLDKSLNPGEFVHVYLADAQQVGNDLRKVTFEKVGCAIGELSDHRTPHFVLRYRGGVDVLPVLSAMMDYAFAFQAP